jgi:STELLO glycosyltransferases
MTQPTGTPTLVVTSINAPNEALRSLARGATDAGWDFLVIGDKKSPERFELDGCRYYSLEQQLESEFDFARACPVGHYARKNLGYLLAAEHGASVIVETDDDNLPLDSFFQIRERTQRVETVDSNNWVNVYRYFTEHNIWPRGLPLDQVRVAPPAPSELSLIDAPIQQGLADDNPDVDAIYRLVLPLPIKFEQDRAVGLKAGSWCPFNSQNTVWWRDAWGLMYLPAYCSFRMTDIWRSFVAQRIAWANGWSVLFTSPTVYQERNEHDLNRDFADEIPGYTQNAEIARLLDAVECEPGVEHIHENMRRCYRMLASKGIVGIDEPALLDTWLRDLERLSKQPQSREIPAGAL